MTAPRLELSAPGRDLETSQRLVRAAEAKGWQGIWISETNGTDAITTGASLAGSLERARLGSAIIPMQTRNPLLMAMTAASLDRLVAGGFVLGLGTSTPVIIEGWHATPFGDSPLATTRECIELVRRFLAGERITTTEGRWQYNRAQITNVPRRRVPIYLGALNDGMLELAGEIADGVILNFVTPDDVRHSMARLADGAARADRSLDDFECVVLFRATVCADYERVHEHYQREFFSYLMAPVYQKMFDREGLGDPCRAVEAKWRSGEREEALASIPTELIRGRALIGDDGEIRARLQAYQDAGMDSAIVIPHGIPGEDPLAETERMIEAMGSA